MVDADDPAIGRIDEVTDPTALTKSEIERQLEQNPNLQGDAISAFADQIADKREPVQENARDLLRKRLTKNGSTWQTRRSDGTFGPGINPDNVDKVSLDMDGRGEVTAQIDDEYVELGTVDVDAGARQDGHGSYQRSLDTYSKRRHPAQQRGGGGA
jgi:hypothetical protein